MIEAIQSFVSNISNLPDKEKIDLINQAKQLIHSVSPFKGEPVDCVLWVEAGKVVANDYNPNSVAPPEMILLKESILQDGYTQPIVSWSRDDVYEVVDGFHRNRVGKECEEVRERVRGYLPLAVINGEREDLTDRMASTIRHNRARGKHSVDGMTEIVVELKRRNWSDDKIAKNLGMDQDEILRLCQLSGLTEMFKDYEFSQSWDIDDLEDEGPEEELIDG